MKALRDVAAVVFELAQVLGGLDPLRDDTQIQAMAELNRRANDVRILDALGHVEDEGPVDLQ